MRGFFCPSLPTAALATITLWDGQTLVRDYYGNTILDFSYDANGQPYAMHYNSTPYFYILNLQGDVIRMVDGNGNTVASYEYDPYGRVISATGSMAEINPLRYRGYYYDSETKLYHLWSRYYDPQTGRFINADEYTSTGQGIFGYNNFIYCGNNPVNRIDPDGHAWKDVKNWFSNTWNKVKKTAQKIVTTVEENAFEGCSSMLTMVLPATLTTVEDSAFANCKNIKSIFFGGTEEQFDAISVADSNEALSRADLFIPLCALCVCQINPAMMPFLSYRSSLVSLALCCVAVVAG